jgi:predicted phosphodiesterase
MRYCIFSDIHSNFDALTSVLNYLKVNPVDQIICLGDIVGYGPEPHQCIEVLQNTPKLRVICGNHDAAAAGRIGDFEFNDTARQALEINKEHMTREDKQYILNLDDTISENDLRFVHGSPRDNLNEYLFLMDKFKENMNYFNERVCFVGHTHHPLIYIYESGTGNGSCMNIEDDVEMFTLSPVKKHIVNVGSVGQPRDYKSSSSIVFFDTKTSTITFRRVPYNYKATQEKMVKLGMPRELVDRIATGT